MPTSQKNPSLSLMTIKRKKTNEKFRQMKNTIKNPLRIINWSWDKLIDAHWLMLTLILILF